MTIEEAVKSALDEIKGRAITYSKEERTDTLRSWMYLDAIRSCKYGIIDGSKGSYESQQTAKVKDAYNSIYLKLLDMDEKERPEFAAKLLPGVIRMAIEKAIKTDLDTLDQYVKGYAREDKANAIRSYKLAIIDGSQDQIGRLRTKAKFEDLYDTGKLAMINLDQDEKRPFFNRILPELMGRELRYDARNIITTHAVKSTVSICMKELEQELNKFDESGRELALRTYRRMMNLSFNTFTKSESFKTLLENMGNDYDLKIEEIPEPLIELCEKANERVFHFSVVEKESAEKLMYHRINQMHVGYLIDEIRSTPPDKYFDKLESTKERFSQLQFTKK